MVTLDHMKSIDLWKVEMQDNEVGLQPPGQHLQRLGSIPSEDSDGMPAVSRKKALNPRCPPAHRSIVPKIVSKAVQICWFL